MGSDPRIALWGGIQPQPDQLGALDLASTVHVNGQGIALQKTSMRVLGVRADQSSRRCYRTSKPATSPPTISSKSVTDSNTKLDVARFSPCLDRLLITLHQWSQRGPTMLVSRRGSIQYANEELGYLPLA